MKLRTKILSILTAKAIIFLTGAWLTYVNHETVQRAHYTLTKGRNHIEENYFPDPAGLSITYPINENGNLEVFLHHDESNRDIAIGVDMLPRNLNDLLEGIEQRVGSGNEHSSNVSDSTTYLASNKLKW